MLRGFALLVCLLSCGLDLAAQSLDGADFRVNVATSENQNASRVATGGDRFAVVWNRSSAGAVGYIRIFDRAANPLTDEIAFTGSGGSPAVAAAPGGFVVAYFQLNGIFAIRYDVSGAAIGSAFRVNQYTSGNRGNPSVATGADGGFVIVWAGQGADDTIGVYGARFDASGTRLVDDFRVNTYTTGNQVKPSVAFSGGSSPEFLVAWTGSGAGDTDGIFARRFDGAGTPLASEFRVNEATTSSTNYPSVAANSEAPVFVVAWQQAASIFAHRYTTVASPEFQVNTTTLVNRPSVAFEPGGSFVVVYSGAHGQRFLSNGSPAGAEFLVTTATVGVNTEPSVAAFAAGNFVATWTNSTRDGSGTGVYGQRFGPRGDADGNGVVGVSDLFYLINFLFAGGPAPLGPADADNTGHVDVADVFFIINYLFAGGPTPAA